MSEEFASDEIDADGVYLVERPKAAPRVPPARRLRGEAIDIVPVYRVAEFTHAVWLCHTWDISMRSLARPGSGAPRDRVCGGRAAPVRWCPATWYPGTEDASSRSCGDRLTQAAVRPDPTGGGALRGQYGANSTEV